VSKKALEPTPRRSLRRRSSRLESRTECPHCVCPQNGHVGTCPTFIDGLALSRVAGVFFVLKTRHAVYGAQIHRSPQIVARPHLRIFHRSKSCSLIARWNSHARDWRRRGRLYLVGPQFRGERFQVRQIVDWQESSTKGSSTCRPCRQRSRGADQRTGPDQRNRSRDHKGIEGPLENSLERRAHTSNREVSARILNQRFHSSTNNLTAPIVGCAKNLNREFWTPNTMSVTCRPDGR